MHLKGIGRIQFSDVMSGEIIGYSSLSEEDVEDKENILCFLNIWLKPNGLEYYVGELNASNSSSPDRIRTCILYRQRISLIDRGHVGWHSC